MVRIPTPASPENEKTHLFGRHLFEFLQTWKFKPARDSNPRPRAYQTQFRKTLTVNGTNWNVLSSEKWKITLPRIAKKDPQSIDKGIIDFQEKKTTVLTAFESPAIKEAKKTLNANFWRYIQIIQLLYPKMLLHSLKTWKTCIWAGSTPCVSASPANVLPTRQSGPSSATFQ